jgi:ribosomal protein S27AE
LAPDPPVPSGPAAGARRWRAACPNCGAPVGFASAASPIAVCGYCHSTLARDGETLRRIGRVGEVFDDHSPLQLGAAGRWDGRAFTLVGRLQMQSPQARWNEWHALFDDAAAAAGRRAWLSEDNGRYALSVDAPVPPALDAIGPLAALRPGLRLSLLGREWQVAAVVRARVATAEGELPALPPLDREFTVVELRNALGEVASLDDADAPALHWSVGRGVELAQLALTGLRDVPEATLQGGVSPPCPNCGAPLTLRLESTKSVVCGQCQAVVDVSAGVGGDLAHFRQNPPRRQPRLPLGATGTLALGGPPRPWQVVGYLERRELGDDPGEPWSEYLLWNRETGFAFVVDAEDGWSWVVPIAGAPTVSARHATWQGRRHTRRWDAYTAETTYVLGEFYWRVERSQRSRNVDYQDGLRRLSREATDDEVVWSAGETIDPVLLGAAFGVDLGRPRAVGTLASGQRPPSLRLGRNIVIAFAVVVLFVSLMERCSEDECDDLRATFGASSEAYRSCLAQRGSGGWVSRSGGGSWGGGYSGGHK